MDFSIEVSHHRAAMDVARRLLHQLSQSPPADRAALRRLKAAVAAETKTALARNDRLLAQYRQELAEGARRPNRQLERLLTLNGIRSHSGVATVTVITEPYACPGRCVYCPTEARAPKSYLTNEPAVRRAIRNAYDPYRQVASRLEALVQTGHPIDKIELIVKGGTWSFYPLAYQETFVRRCVEAANAFGDAATASNQPPTTIQPETLGAVERTLRENERARCRIIGITVETRPDYIDIAEVRRLRSLGVTRVELGVQILDDGILALVVRDHGTAEVRQATRQLKDAGFKVAYHLMPNLPGATPEQDLASARALFEDPAYQPDTLKLYPCVVVESAELFQWWQAGRYRPYPDEVLIALLLQIKQLVPPHVRIERIIRDIPSTSIQGGCRVTNLRETLQRQLRARGLRCRCIRCRQVREDAAGTFQLVRRQYAASGGVEVFLSFEDPSTDRLASLLRLRLPEAEAPTAFPALQGAALIRELHSYGQHVPLQARATDAVQHQGLGRRLVAEAERIAREEFGRTRIVVIAGVGAREYYRHLGYTLEETYMIKRLA